MILFYFYGAGQNVGGFKFVYRICIYCLGLILVYGGQCSQFPFIIRCKRFMIVYVVKCYIIFFFLCPRILYIIYVFTLVFTRSNTQKYIHTQHFIYVFDINWISGQNKNKQKEMVISFSVFRRKKIRSKGGTISQNPSFHSQLFEHVHISVCGIWCLVFAENYHILSSI